MLNLIRFRKTKNHEVEFDRIPVIYTGGELDEWEQTIQHIDKEMKLCEESGFWPKTGSSCSSAFGDCTYRPMCSVGGDVEAFVEAGQYQIGEG